MKFYNIASGSKGNATFISTDNTLILIDAGISYRELVKRSNAVGIDLNRLDAVLITHEHSDHIQGLKTLSNELEVPIYMNPASYKALSEKVGSILHVQEEEFIHHLFIKDLEISACRHMHDAAYTQGFLVSDGKKSIGLATDLGKVTPAIFDKMKQTDFLYIESNYDEQSLINGPYPKFLKYRISGKNGHLSNVDSASTIRDLIKEGKERFMLAHLSETNNTEQLAKDTLLKVIGEIGACEKDIDLHIAKQHVPSEVIEV